jgi:hypothetical protein
VRVGCERPVPVLAVPEVVIVVAEEPELVVVEGDEPPMLTTIVEGLEPPDSMGPSGWVLVLWDMA